ncbi:hypothetical protein [Orenia marismortui]|uniref:Stage III sporulation protein AG n=1 Tax=Orenia marismortui TaxID=46469 RepID=A0A4R8GQY3_9FIRM|nr:hypothetical protein [Orenia marismortui]TDX48236.1 stage III sporulation protein AG [Orenia marismortui]
MNNLFGKDGLLNKSQFKFIRYLLVLILAGVFLMLLGDFGNDISGSNSKKKLTTKQSGTYASADLSLEEIIEDKLTAILSEIDGVGDVSVDITLDSATEYTYAKNHQDSRQETIEEDNAGGNRKTIQYENRSDIVLLNKGGEQIPLIKKEVKPKIRGVLVVAEGAQDSYIKSNLFRAIKVGLGVPSYKIVILSKER